MSMIMVNGVTREMTAAEQAEYDAWAAHENDPVRVARRRRATAMLAEVTASQADLVEILMLVIDQLNRAGVVTLPPRVADALAKYKEVIAR